MIFDIKIAVVIDKFVKIVTICQNSYDCFGRKRKKYIVDQKIRILLILNLSHSLKIKKIS
jgi:hypothetical protein